MTDSLFVDTIAKLLCGGRRVRFLAPGGSMYPTIRNEEVIGVEPVKPSEIKRGDIILYRNGKGVIAHRVVRIANERPTASALSFEYSSPDPQSSIFGTFFILRGDASDTCDEPVEGAQILGKVVSVDRNGRIIDLNSKRTKIVNTVGIYALRLRRGIRSRLSSILELSET